LKGGKGLLTEREIGKRARGIRKETSAFLVKRRTPAAENMGEKMPKDVGPQEKWLDEHHEKAKKNNCGSHQRD